MNTKRAVIDKFRAGLRELLFVNPQIGSMARAMGSPVWAAAGGTACVRYDPATDKIRFEMSEAFVKTLTEEQTAGVVAHETYHVILNHLREAADPIYTNARNLVVAHECIVNDSVTSILQLDMPDGLIHGMDRVGRNCAHLSTMAVYRLLEDKKNDPDTEDNNSDDNSGESAQGDSSDESSSNSGSSSAGGDEQGDSDSSDNDKNDHHDNDERSENGDSGSGADESASDENDDPDVENGDSFDNEGEGSESGEDEHDGSDCGGDEVDGSGPESEENSDVDSDEDGCDGEADDLSGDDEPANGADESAPHHGACGGVIVPEGFEKKAQDAINKIIGEAADDLGVSPAELVDVLSGSVQGGFSMGGAPVASQAPALSAERMNWKRLLARINPKILEAGKRKSRSRNNWTKPNRRMSAVYPRVILPVREPVVPNNSKKGDSLPVMVIALDLSMSIPRELVGALQGMLDEIPEDLIKSYPATWATTLIPYEKGGRVADGVTNFEYVVDYVKKIKDDTGVDPYVLVITDGCFAKVNNLPGREWFWMSVSQKHIENIVKNGHEKRENIHVVQDFMV